jgi:hypothetical protein
MANKPITVVYVMGYGRSGSTITDILLNSHPDIISVGALNNVYQWMLEHEACACGEELVNCSFWSDVVERHIGYPATDSKFMAQVHKMLRCQDSVERMRQYASVLFNKVSQIRKVNYREQMNDLLINIAETSGKHIVVDSSKSTRDCTGRPLALYRYSDVNIKVIHLVRDGRGVAWSAMKCAGSGERKRISELKLYNFMRTSLSWMITNFLALMTKWKLDDDHYMLLRYEDLCESPESELNRIGEFVGIDITRIKDHLVKGEKLDVGHNLGGNRVRFSRSVSFNPDVKWKSDMPMHYKLFFWVLAWPILRVFQYRLTNGR